MVISRHISGAIRKKRYIVEAILGSIYIIVPWLTWMDKPLMRLDVPARKFHLLGNIFIPQEGIFLHLFLLSAGLSLFFFTSLIGRVWCGWACPQTVFTDFFDVIGRLILGNKYGKKDANPYLKFVLHSVWILFSLFAAFHIVAYFNDPREMIARTIHLNFQDVIFPYLWAFFAGLLYVDMTMVREQFCKYACPYARFQTVMMDADSYNVTYDHNRGEPRRNKKEKLGDCTACNMCLVVCPTGIDIRDGLNVGCIACGKCIDACTIQMGKENKKSLINYDSLNRVEKNQKIRWIRPRTVIYATILSVVLSTAVILLNNRVPLYASVIPDRNLEPMIIPGQKVRNFYNLNLRNMTYEDRELKLEIIESEKLHPIIRTGSEDSKVKIPANGSAELRIFIETDNLPKLEKSAPIVHVKMNIEDVSNQKFKINKLLPLRLPDDPTIQ
ncbi:MAG: cytochrome c oxidase accessory protein CcoG [Leptospiraceae bacterium]|nr:cytochrome c oxidase accessory protein CcoG [Leptospiraceae bacterium]